MTILIIVLVVSNLKYIHQEPKRGGGFPFWMADGSLNFIVDSFDTAFYFTILLSILYVLSSSKQLVKQREWIEKHGLWIFTSTYMLLPRWITFLHRECRIILQEMISQVGATCFLLSKTLQTYESNRRGIAMDQMYMVRWQFIHIMKASLSAYW